MNGTHIDSAPEATHPPASGGRLVVGLDGSVGSLAALRWAAQQARLHGGAVHAVMAWQHPQAYGAANIWGLGMDPSLDTETLLASATAEAARLGGQADRSPDVVITTEAVEGHPAEVLLGAAESAGRSRGGVARTWRIRRGTARLGEPTRGDSFALPRRRRTGSAT